MRWMSTYHYTYWRISTNLVANAPPPLALAKYELSGTGSRSLVLVKSLEFLFIFSIYFFYLRYGHRSLLGIVQNSCVLLKLKPSWNMYHYVPCSGHVVMKFYSELVEYTVLVGEEMPVRVRLLPIFRKYSLMVERFTDWLLFSPVDCSCLVGGGGLVMSVCWVVCCSYMIHRYRRRSRQGSLLTRYGF